MTPADKALVDRLSALFAAVEVDGQKTLEKGCEPIFSTLREQGYRQGVESCCVRVCDRCRNPKDNPPATFRYGRWLHGDWACTASTIRGLPVERCLQ